MRGPGRPVRDLTPREIGELRVLHLMYQNAGFALNNYLVGLVDKKVDQSHIGEILGIKTNAVHMRVARWKK